MKSSGKNLSTGTMVSVNSNNRNAGFSMLTIRGIVIPVDWDVKGNVVGIAVSTYDEDEYFICGQDKGEELLAHIRKEVEISGVLIQEKGKKTIIVKDYRSKKV